MIGLTDDEAGAKYRESASLGSIETGLGFLSRSFNDHDFSQYDLDGPFPDVAYLGRNSNQSTSDRILAEVRADGLTIREIAQRLSTPRGTFAGTPTVVADELQRWFDQEGADGFVVFETLPGQLELFVEHVVPILQTRRRYHEDYAGETFREHLGLPFPVNRHAAARGAREAA